MNNVYYYRDISLGVLILVIAVYFGYLAAWAAGYPPFLDSILILGSLYIGSKLLKLSSYMILGVNIEMPND
jgi:hypothetical protein